MKRILSLILIIMMLAGTTAFAAALPDIEGQPYEAAVQALYDKGVITGDVDGQYHGDSNLTRAQAAIIIVKAIDPLAADLVGTASQTPAQNGFRDMSGYGWAADFINYMVSHDITVGYPDGTFKPGRNVSVAEMITFAVRAAGYTDSKLGGTWPSNYIEKAAELGLTANLGDISDVSAPAAKWQMAQITYDALDEIAAAAAAGPEEGDAADAGAASGMVFSASGKFDSDITEYDGKALSSEVVVYEYGEKRNFVQGMKLPADSELLVSNIYRYKNVTTPAWYKTEGGKITAMIVPGDVGFNGTVYCVINGISQVANAEGKSVAAFNTITAGHNIAWEYKAADAPAVYTSTRIPDGHVFELEMGSGVVQTVYTVAAPSRPSFRALGGTGTGWQAVTAVDGNTVTLANGQIVEMEQVVSVYTLLDDKDEFVSGSKSSVRVGKFVRMYDIVDDGGDTAWLVTVCNAVR